MFVIEKMRDPLLYGLIILMFTVNCTYAVWEMSLYFKTFAISYHFTVGIGIHSSFMVSHIMVHTRCTIFSAVDLLKCLLRRGTYNKIYRKYT
jgi:hypothetical protein